MINLTLAFIIFFISSLSLTHYKKLASLEEAHPVGYAIFGLVIIIALLVSTALMLTYFFLLMIGVNA